MLRLTLVFALQILFASQLISPLGLSDPGQILNTALLTDMNNPIGDFGTLPSEYFSLFPNNIFLLFGERGFIKIFGEDNILFKLSILNILCIDITILLMYKICEQRFTKTIASYVAVLSVLLIGFTPWIVIPYTDIFSMFFITLAFYLYTKLSNTNTINKKILFSFSIGICGGFGYLIKPTTIILFIAIYLIDLLFVRKDIKQKIPFFAIIVITIVIICTSFQLFASRQKQIKITPNRGTPLTHFMMMGLKQVDTNNTSFYGIWNETDVAITFSNATSKEMRTANILEIKKRLKDYGIVGYVKYLSKKARWITSEGNFFWGGEGGFIDYSFSQPSILKEIFYPQGQWFSVYLNIIQGIWIFVFLGFIFSSILAIKSTEPFIMILRFSVMGILLFILLFEGRSRYLFNHLPFILILSGYGYGLIGSRVKKLIQ